MHSHAAAPPAVSIHTAEPQITRRGVRGPGACAQPCLHHHRPCATRGAGPGPAARAIPLGARHLAASLLGILHRVALRRDAARLLLGRLAARQLGGHLVWN